MRYSRQFSLVIFAQLAVRPAEAAWQHEPSWPAHSSQEGPPDIVDTQELQAEWDEAVHTVWTQVSSRVSFCLGSNHQRILHLLQQSFPPLPVGPLEDEVCGNATRLAWHLCGKQEIQEYYKARQLWM